ncbi:hypothetical protein SAMN05443428_1475 [Caloramator quimbayensis]|uniref:Uncharacterized protein n=1 Tax=Caloramator quimbayensis TaxID=1147123 RepID=A0A1T4YG13_9CLOT|nr:hypothetical protein SAMN05443428_1475 [Caloramator quimbayensis]
MKYIFIFIIIYFFFSLIISYKLKNSKEKYFISKIFIYFIISSIYIYIEELIPIPIGIFISIILLKMDKRNRISKIVCIISGFLCSIICVILYYLF